LLQVKQSFVIHLKFFAALRLGVFALKPVRVVSAFVHFGDVENSLRSVLCG